MRMDEHSCHGELVSLYSYDLLNDGSDDSKHLDWIESDVQISSDNKGFIISDSKGKVIFTGVTAIYEVTVDVILVKTDNGFGCFNYRTNTVIQPVYDNVHYMVEDDMSIPTYIFVKDNLMQVYDWETGTLSNLTFEDFKPFYDGVGSVKINGKWGVINQKGSIVCEPMFDEIERLDMNFFILDSKEIISKKGAKIISNLPDYMGIYSDRYTYIFDTRPRQFDEEAENIEWYIELYYLEDRIIFYSYTSDDKDTMLLIYNESGQVIPTPSGEIETLLGSL